MKANQKMYEYYSQSQTLPTYARIKDRCELQAHIKRRKDLFLNELCIPPRIFKGLRLVEFGPDAGENALAFASWGADVTLVEPNPNAWHHISDYFHKFGLEERLRSLLKCDIENFDTSEKFDFIDAEGFIYTVRPNSLWIELFKKILAEDGLFVISYTERYGSFLELVFRLVYARVRRNLNDKDMAWQVFRTKWESIPHSRSFDSWVLDVLENPFVSAKYFFDMAKLLTELRQSGFELYSSWPRYQDGLGVHWHKRLIGAEERLKSNIDFLKRSQLSFLFGKKAFICSESETAINSLDLLLSSLLNAVDSAIGCFDTNKLDDCLQHLNELEKFLNKETVLTDSRQDKTDMIKLLGSIKRLFSLLNAGRRAEIIDFCNTDKLFINSWGQPHHFAVFKEASDDNEPES